LELNLGQPRVELNLQPQRWHLCERQQRERSGARQQQQREQVCDSACHITLQRASVQHGDSDQSVADATRADRGACGSE
jgi:hypothetical protein